MNLLRNTFLKMRHLGPNCRTWDGVGRDVLFVVAVDVDDDRRVGRAVSSRQLRNHYYYHTLGFVFGKSRIDNTYHNSRSRRPAAAARHRQLRALGVELRLVCARVDREQLMAEHVVAGGEVRGDCRRPRRVVRDELAHAPVAVANGAAQEPCLVDLEPVEGSGACAGAVSAAVLFMRNKGEEAKPD